MKRIDRPYRKINDKLLFRIFKDGKVFTQRKRLPNNTTAYIRKIQKIYAEEGVVEAVKFIKVKRKGLKESLDYLNSLRY